MTATRVKVIPHGGRLPPPKIVFFCLQSTFKMFLYIRWLVYAAVAHPSSRPYGAQMGIHGADVDATGLYRWSHRRLPSTGPSPSS
jgi:hypothetical protein